MVWKGMNAAHPEWIAMTFVTDFADQDLRMVQAPLKPRILVIDDEQVVRKVVGTMLSFLGYPAKFCIDSSEGFDAYENGLRQGQPFEVVLLDMSVPTASRITAARRFRERIPEIRLVAMTGYLSDREREMFFENGFCATLTKPFTLDQLKRVIERTVFGRAGGVLLESEFLRPDPVSEEEPGESDPQT